MCMVGNYVEGHFYGIFMTFYCRYRQPSQCPAFSSGGRRHPNSLIKVKPGLFVGKRSKCELVGEVFGPFNLLPLLLLVQSAMQL